MVNVEIETIKFSDLKDFKINGYKLDENVMFETESVSYTSEETEDDYITFSMITEFDQFGHELEEKGVLVEITENCSPKEYLHFSPNSSWNAIQAFFERNY